MRFADVLGQVAPKATLIEATRRDRLHHAYLFTGPDGVGKRRLAYAFAARLFCRAPTPDGDACGACRDCKRVTDTHAFYEEHGVWKGTDDAPPLMPKHPDLVTLVPHGQYIRVAQIREMLRVVPFQPVEAVMRLVIIEPADQMNDEAANALLKTLEEPPSKTRFVLVTSLASSLLVTIRSRCQQLAFKRLDTSSLTAIVTARTAAAPLDPTVLANAVALADGSARAALAIVDDPLAAAWDELARKVLLADARASLPGVLEVAAALAEAPSRESLFARLARLLRDALIVRAGLAQPLLHEALRPEISAWAASRSVDAIIQIIAILEDTRTATRVFNVIPRLAFERLLMSIAAAPGTDVATPVIQRRDIL